jgi:hypothetical protein
MTHGSDDSTDPIAADADQHDGTTSVPSDNTTLTSVIEGLIEEGYTSQLSAEPGAELLCSACGMVSGAAEFDVHSLRRLEGASDPDDMVAAVAAVCPKCAVPGIAVLAFGPTGSETDADVMVALDLSTRGAEHHDLDEPT